MTISAHSPSPSLSHRTRFLSHPVTRIVIAVLAVTLPIALTMFLVQQTLEKSMRQIWPQLLCVVFSTLAYVAYVKKLEKRDVTELSYIGAGRELGFGVAIGVLLILSVISMLMLTGSFHIVGVNSWTTLLSPISEVLLVAIFEEILFRGILFRIIEKSLGTKLSLLISAILFALAHLPHDGISLLAVLVTAVAGLMFCAAYMLTRRLWLVIGIHFAWNYMSDAVLSIPTSGHQAKGFLQGQLSGSEWLSGGAYGIEASFVTLIVISIATICFLKIANTREQNTLRKSIP